MRVALVGPYPRAEGRVCGGVEAVTSALADGLALVPGLEVHAVTSVGGLEHIERFETQSGVHVHLVPESRKLGCLTAFAVDVARIRRALREIAPDIIHCHTQLMYARASVEAGWPSILTVHGILFRETAPARGLSRAHARLACAYEMASLRKARHMTAINHYAVNAYGGRIRTDDIRYIDNPIEDRYFEVPDKSEPGRILFAGVITDRKNVRCLLEAVAALVASHPRVRLRIAGAAVDPGYYEACQALVSERGIKENVEFLGAVSIDEMLEEHARASMLVLPSWQETAPVVISEAMAAGTPVVATDVGGVAEMIKNGKSGFVVSLGDSQELISKIDCLLTDDQLRKQMGEAGKAIAESRFRRSVVVNKTVEFYRDVIESERKRAGK